MVMSFAVKLLALKLNTFSLFNIYGQIDTGYFISGTEPIGITYHNFMYKLY